MTACPSEEQLALWLAAGEDTALAGHIETCEPCQAVLERLTDTHEPPGRPAVERRALTDSFLPPAARQDSPTLTAGERHRIRDLVAREQTHTDRNGQGDGAGVFEMPRVPGYEVLGLLGRGGMGVVWKARHVRLGRPVALKMIQGGEHATPEQRIRFGTEAEMMARLSHPNVVQIYEVGTHQTQPYLALEFVDGRNLAEAAGGRPQPPRRAAALVETLARAIHHAHQQGIVHRDLKPANVLLDAGGLDGAVPKIADFGLAQMLQIDLRLTQTGAVAGTPSYMAPEQARSGREKVGPATDVYSLGAILYELLTGRPPFVGATPLDVLMQLADIDPVAPSRLAAKLPRDLDTIVLKCLHKDPRHRYASAEALADDLARFTHGRPIEARPVGPIERLIKWTRRRPAVAALLGAVVLVTAAGLGLTTWQWREAERQRKISAQVAAGERRLSTRLVLGEGHTLCEQGQVDHGLLHFARGLESAEQTGQADLERLARLEITLWQEQFIRQRRSFEHSDWAWAAALSPDARTLLTAGFRERQPRLFDTTTGKEIAELRPEHRVMAVAISNDGKLLVTAGGTEDGRTGELRLWGPAGEPLLHLRPDSTVLAVALSADGRRCLTVNSLEAQLWDTATGAVVWGDWRHGGRHLTSGLLSPDGLHALTGGADGTARLWDLETGREKAVFRHQKPVLALAFSPDGKRALTGDDRAARLWAVDRPDDLPKVLPHLGEVRTAAFSPDGKTVATGSTLRHLIPLEVAGIKAMTGLIGGGELRFWSAETGRPIGKPQAHPKPVWCLAFSPDGRRLLTGSEDGFARLFGTASAMPVGRPMPCGGTLRVVTFDRGGRLALTAGCSSRAILWELPPERQQGRVVLRTGANCRTLALSPDGDALLAGSVDKNAYLVDTRTGKALLPPMRHERGVGLAAFSADGASFLTAGAKQTAQLWDRRTGRLLQTFRQERGFWEAAFHPDGKTLLTASDQAFHLWDVKTGEPRGPRRPSPGVVSGPISFHEGEAAAILTEGREVRFWEPIRDRMLQRWHQPEKNRLLVVSPDGHLLFGKGVTQVVLRDAATGQAFGRPLMHEKPITSGAFTSEGIVATGGWEDCTRLWDVATCKPLGPPLLQGECLTAITTSADGRLMATAGWDVRLWDLPIPLRGSPEIVRLRIEALTGLALDQNGTARPLEPEDLADRRLRLAEMHPEPEGDQSP